MTRCTFCDRPSIATRRDEIMRQAERAYRRPSDQYWYFLYLLGVGEPRKLVDIADDLVGKGFGEVR